ncbi:MAG: carboxypeptidase M32 [Planctomycetota bacterium]|nr:MAG: carboxypeptidase M32 [Planctomycetota bacterium]
MDPTAARERLVSLWREIEDLRSVSAVLEWDQETFMPELGQEARGRQLALLAGLAHERLTATELGEAIAAAAEAAADDPELAAMAREARRQHRRAAAVPAELARELAEATSAALAVWQEARRRSDFPRFRDALARVVELRRRQAAAIDPNRPAYEVLLDEYEPGATVASLEPVFRQLRERLAPLIQAVAASGVEIDESPARGRFPVPAQRAFGLEVAERLGFDFRAGRLDPAPHPFCTTFGRGDVRITWRWQEDDFRPALFGIMHEAGHGLYEQGLPAAWAGSPIGQAVSLGVHESQSRLWENLVGRSRAFWRWATPIFRRHFPDHPTFDPDRIWPALHTVRPSLIRVEADEATYNLHIAIRFDVERRLFAGELEVDDLPAAWNEGYEELLGIRPGNDAEGVLQDIHWAMGAFGYFPTYTLGNLICCQLFESAAAELGDLDQAFAAGDFAPLLGWLRSRVHEAGSRWSAAELVERVSGRPLAADAFLRHIRRIAEEAYGVVAEPA